MFVRENATQISVNWGYTHLTQELEKLAQQFEENILDATKSFEKVITDKKELEGLPSTTLSITAKTAIDKVSEEWQDFQVLADSALNLIAFHTCPFIYQGYENATAEDGPWIITLDGPIYRSVLQHACNRSLREEIFRAYVTRASDGPLNNTPIIERVLELRLEKAKLLGFKNYAEVLM